MICSEHGFNPLHFCPQCRSVIQKLKRESEMLAEEIKFLEIENRKPIIVLERK